MDQPLNALLQLDKSSVVGNAQYASLYVRADGVPLRRILANVLACR